MPEPKAKSQEPRAQSQDPTIVTIVAAKPADLDRYLDLLEGVAEWLDACGITQWKPGNFRLAAAFYAESITRGEVHLACDDGGRAVGTLRLVLRDPIVWPDVADDDGVYVYNLAIARDWAGRGLGPSLLDWAAVHAMQLGRSFVRLDCMTGNEFLRRYYERAGFTDRGDIDATFPSPVGTLRLRRYERRAELGSGRLAFGARGSA